MSDEKEKAEEKKPEPVLAFGNSDKFGPLIEEIGKFEAGLEKQIKSLYTDDGNRDKVLPAVFDQVLNMITTHRELVKGLLLNWKMLFGHALALYSGLNAMIPHAESWNDELGERLYDMKDKSSPDYAELKKATEDIAADIAVAKSFTAGFEKRIHAVPANGKEDKPVEGD